MKICTKCKVEKHESEFFKKSSRKSGLSSSCKPCDLSGVRASISKNQDRYSKYQRNYYLENRDSILSRTKKDNEILPCHRVRSLLARGTFLDMHDIPNELVMLKREQIKLNRLIKEMKK
jgi:hypothetical protein